MVGSLLIQPAIGHGGGPTKEDWATPPELFAKLDAVYHFDLDVCATADNAKCARFYSPEDNGLAQDWTGVCWMNPPYGRKVRDWMAKACEAGRNGVIVVCLVFARTDTRWWHDHAMQATWIAFIRGRVRFVGADSGAPFPSALVVFGPGPQPPFPTVQIVTPCRGVPFRGLL